MAALRLWIWTCFVVVLVMKTSHVQGQSVVISASNVFVLGDEKSLYCAVTTTQLVTVEWVVDGAVRAGTQLPTQVVSGWYVQKSRYTFTVAASDDGKVYTCRATQGTNVITDRWTVYVYRHPDNPVISGPNSVLGGTTAEWVCKVDGAVGSSPGVTWRFGNGTSIAGSLYNSVDGTYSSTSNGLLVRNVTSTLTLPITNGAPSFSLECKATQSATSVTKFTTLGVAISFPPEVTVPRASYTVTEGNSVTLQCDVRSTPPASAVRWHRGNEAVNVTLDRYAGGTPATPSLTISPANKADAGSYTCRATNSIGSSDASAPISLVVRYVPVITYTQNPVSGELNSDVELSCSVDAVPAFTTITWFRITGSNPETTVTIKPGDNPSKYSGGTASTPALTLKSLANADQGLYRCVADNNVGRGRGALLRVDVVYVGQSTEDSGLSLTTLILIIIVCIILLIVIILIIVYCCVSGRCRRQKKDNTVSPSVVAPPPPPIVPAGEKSKSEKPIAQRPPSAVAATATPNGHVSASTAPLSARSGNGHLGTPRDKTDPTARNGTASLGHGMSISLPGTHTPRPHHLPPLGQDGVPEETESADDDKHRKKKRRRRQNADGNPQNVLQV